VCARAHACMNVAMCMQRRGRGAVPRAGATEKHDLIAKLMEVDARSAVATPAAVPLGFVMDPASGYYFNAETGWYYHAESRCYYRQGTWYSLDSSGQLVECSQR
jgi:hypothetical protein